MDENLEIRKDGLPGGSGLASQLWAANEALALESLHSPFVTGLGAGTLAKSTFRHYVGQDAFFLQYFARAYALAMTKCDPEQHEQLSELLKGVCKELKLHHKYATFWGVDLSTVRPSPATLAYTDFLMEVALDEKTTLAEVLCAMAPCSRLYAFLGCTLAKAFPEASHSYKLWIMAYSSPQYNRIPAIKESILEKSADAADQGRLRQLYTRAMQLEAAFFQGQPHLPAPRQIRSLVVDYDDTCTQRDTVAVFLTTAARIAEQASGSAAAEAIQSASKELSANYYSKYTALLDTHLGDAAADGTAASAYDPQGLSAFLDTLSDFDQSMMKPVEDSGVLKATHDVSLRPGCRHVLQRALALGLPTHILSVNWSTTLIEKQETPLSGPTVNLLVANELEMTQGPSGEAVCTGRVVNRVSTARDKGWAYRAMRATAGPRAGTDVYVGDSPTDLPALLQADVGIVIGSSSSLRRVCVRYGVSLKPLVSAPGTGKAPAGVLYEASSWDEIGAFLFGPGDYEAHPYRQQMEAMRALWHTQPLTGNDTPPVTLSTPAPHSSVTDTHTATQTAPHVPIVMSIAGSDSGGGAGIQADLKAMQACGVFGTTAVTALTAQNTRGVQAVCVTPLDILAAQIDSVLGDIGADAVKTGMLPSQAIVKLVADKVRQYNVRWLVVDPVMVSTSGDPLVGQEVVEALTTQLLPLAQLVTPNLPEASGLLDGRAINDVQDMCEAAKALHTKLGCGAVLVKGGHLVGSGAAAPVADGGGNAAAATAPTRAIVHGEPAPQPGGGGVDVRVVTDILYDGKELHVMHMPAVPCPNTHGTGCTLASSISSYLARGLPVLSAVIKAREYLSDCLRHSVRLHVGIGVQRPFNHGWQLADWQRVAGHTHESVKGPLGQGYVGRWSTDAVRKAMTLYAVTDTNCNTKHNRSTEEAVAAAVAGGATIVQIREKDCDGGVFLERAAAALQVCRAAGVPLVINDRIDIALALGPDVGVHIGQSDIPTATARALLGPGRMLGVSCKTEAEARAAVAAGADYLGVGAVYSTTTKVTSDAIGLEGLTKVVAAAKPAPVVAIGGIKAEHIDGVIATGAAGIAVVTAIFDADDIRAATQALRSRITAAQTSHSA